MPTAQTTLTTEATLDKLLGANFLSLALIALVMVVAMFLLFVWMNNKREAANDKRQDALIKVFTDDKSPMVISNNRAANAIELGNSRSKEQTEALIALGEKTDKQTNSIEAQTGVISGQSLDLRNYQTLVSDNLNNHSDQIAANTANIAALKAAIEALPAQLREVIEDKLFCAGVEETINQMRDEVLSFIHAEQTKRSAAVPASSDVQPG